MNGTISRLLLDKGFGFIAGADGQEYFMHRSAIRDGSAFEQLREGQPKGAQLPDGSYQFSATGQVYRGPGAPANGPPHHYVFELYALDTKLDVQPAADAFETRANVMKAIQGHVLGKAVYMGLFRRPQ